MHIISKYEQQLDQFIDDFRDLMAYIEHVILVFENDSYHLQSIRLSLNMFIQIEPLDQ